MKFPIYRVPSWHILKFLNFGRFSRSWPRADDHKNKIQDYTRTETFQTSPHMLDLNYWNSSYSGKSEFLRVRVLVKARNLYTYGTNP